MPITTFVLIVIFSDNGIILGTSFLMYFLSVSFIINESFKVKVILKILESPFRKYILFAQNSLLIAMVSIAIWNFMIASYMVGIIVAGASLIWYNTQRSIKKHLDIESCCFITCETYRKIL